MGSSDPPLPTDRTEQRSADSLLICLTVIFLSWCILGIVAYADIDIFLGTILVLLCLMANYMAAIFGSMESASIFPPGVSSTSNRICAALAAFALTIVHSLLAKYDSWDPWRFTFWSLTAMYAAVGVESYVGVFARLSRFLGRATYTS